MKNIKFSLLSLLLLLTTLADAANYYVSASGNDSNNGTSTATPWKSLSKVQSVCNSGTIKAGDFILFNKGDVFTGSLLMASIWGYSAQSGTVDKPITFSSYGTGAKPVLQYPTGGSTQVTQRVVFWFVAVNYIVVDGLNFTDLVNTTNDKVAVANIGYAIYLGIPDEATTNHCTIKNVDISLCGMGVAVTGDFNTITNSTLTNFKNLINTYNGGDDDYGANAVTLLGSDNQILNNYISSAWAYSSDFGWNGGACEMYNNCNRNKIMYNTIVDCDGISEFGGEGGTTANDNLFAYNKLINCGQLTWVNTSGDFAMQASNVQYFNNVIVENNLSRFSGPNVGAGNTHPLAHYPESNLFGFSGTPNASVVFNLKNNIYLLSTGIDITGSSYVSKTTHQDNIYQLSNNSVTNFTLSSSELSTSAAVLSNTSASDPQAWNYMPAAGSPAIDFGQNLGLTKDFAGNTVPAIPNAGILENGTSGSTLLAASSAPPINCNGGTTIVTVSASGGTVPYTGTGSFTVAAGSYNYTVTDAGGNTSTTSITVAQPTVISVTATAGSILVFGGNTSVTVSASGGTAPYTYSITSGVYQSSNIFSTILAGNYTITVKDSKGCTSTKAVSITQPGAPNQLTASSTFAAINCNGSSTTVTVSASGGTTPYTGTGNFTVTAGTFTYTVTDATGTVKTTTITVTQPTAISGSVDAPGVYSASAKTTATITAAGGSPGYTYSLDNGSYQSSNVFLNVAVGSHSVRIKDAHACIYTKSFTVSLLSANPLVVSAVSGFINCNGGSTTVTVSATGGVAPYTGTGTFTVSAGIRTYTVTDAAGTVATKTLTVVQPKPILVSVATGTITTFGGSATVTVTASGGTGTLLYELNSGSYQSLNIFTNVIAGTYTVTVKDARGCTGVAGFTLTQPAQGFHITLVYKTDVTCGGANNGTIKIMGANGSAPYTYKKNNGNYSSNNTFNNLAPASYTMSCKDATGAVTTMLVVIANNASACRVATGKGNIEEHQDQKKTDNSSQFVDGLQVTAFPNPTSTQFSLIAKSDNDKTVQITVMNMNGQKVYEGTGSINSRITFGNSFAAGIYFVRVVQADRVNITKLIKTR